MQESNKHKLTHTHVSLLSFRLSRSTSVTDIWCQAIIPPSSSFYLLQPPHWLYLSLPSLQLHYFCIKKQDDPCNCLQWLDPNERRKHITLRMRHCVCVCVCVSSCRALTKADNILRQTCLLHPLNQHICVCVSASLLEPWPAQIIFSQTFVPPF